MQAAQRQGFNLARACDAGTCQLCEAQLLQGKVRLKNSNTLVDATTSGKLPIYPCIAIPLQNIQLEVINVLAPGELPIQEIHAQVTSVQQASGDVKLIELRLPAGKKIEFHAGQYLEILLPDSVVAAFSIASAPRQDRTLELHIRANSQSDSYALLEPLLQTGSLLHIRLPKGGTTLHKLDTASHIVFVAASTGYSQMQSLLQALIEQHDKRPMHVYWGARNAEDLYLHEQAMELAQTQANLTYTPVVSDQAAWPGRKGLVHEAVLEDCKDFNNAVFVLCGSPPMVYAVFDDFIAAGIKPQQIISDVFDYAPR